METGDYALLLANGATLGEVLDLHAHALAERQRVEDFSWYEKDEPGASMAREHLADLIDPEMKKGN